MSSDPTTLVEVVSWLASEDIHCWIFGGWAEELRGLTVPRPHADIDLLYRGRSLDAVDSLLRKARVVEIAAKRSSYKRAFEFNATMVELFLVGHDQVGPYSVFQAGVRYDWPADVFSSACGLPVASSAALLDYRARYNELRRGTDNREPHRTARVDVAITARLSVPAPSCRPPAVR